nr:phosphoribosylamine--glycine ligase [Maliibacterium massiliense]
MKVLVVGGGGREHALVWKLKQSAYAPELYCAPGNAGIAKGATCVPIAAADVAGMVAWAKENGMDFVVVAPDDPLALGMVDALEAAGIPTFGPRKDAARIEASKVFAKELMRKYNIPTARATVFDDADAARAYIREQGAPIVVKADGLALGKGVIVAMTEREALDAVDLIMEQRAFGAAGARVLVEQYITGPEVSVLCFTDGRHIVPMVSAQDHKRALDGDAGKNTGGMGAFAPTPKYTPEMAEIVERTIMRPTIDAMAAEGCPFCGVLYFGLMLTKDGPMVLEYNARFGDPETQVVLPLLDGDLLDIMMKVRAGALDQAQIAWRDQTAVVVVLASGGYPDAYEKGKPIVGLEQAGNMPGVMVFHAGTAHKDGRIVTDGGRVLGVTALGADMRDARTKAYAAVAMIDFDAVQYRSDIGRKK